MNPMKKVRIEKLTLNVGAGKDQAVLEKGLKLLTNLTGINAIKTVTKKRIPGWGLRPGLPIGCKITLRGEKASGVLKRLLKAKDHLLTETQFDENGNVAFGLHEYIDIPGMEYDPKIGIMGLECCVTLSRPGFRIKRRFKQKSKVGKTHIIKKVEAIDFMKENFNVKIGDSQ
jgi:large subunit ribosomal protein L5